MAATSPAIPRIQRGAFLIENRSPRGIFTLAAVVARGRYVI